MTITNLTVLLSEFKRAQDIAVKIEEGEGDWEELFAPSDFFTHYKNFVMIETSALSQDGTHILYFCVCVLLCVSCVV
eukprot:CAMPEP_0179901582 /NCGR_PEP_ID=MMETSP0982-20121206/39915_1 /TAXON_ID=483367 /ORGANISM="non described non described, Strain CCMP 2436" /LENGTH=76 /DNA_ID=CAMNT_0021800287 /DNA_START=23 /DNA_END=253 /DNA_ORIENTATION=-